MNILTVKKAYEDSGISNFDMKNLIEVSTRILFDGEPVFDEVFNKQYFKLILPFLQYRKKSIERGYKKNPNIKFDVLLEISERVSDLESFGKLVLEHIEENPTEKPVNIESLKIEYERLNGLSKRISEKLDKVKSQLNSVNPQLLLS